AVTANRNKVGIVDLRSGTVTTLEDVQSYAISRRGTHVALRRYNTDSASGRGSDLVIRDLDQGTAISLGNVAEYAWSDDGSLLGTSYRQPQWSDDGSMIFVGIAPREPKPLPAGLGAPLPARVEVWHWKDLREYHAQAVLGAQDRTRTQLAAWQLKPNKLVVLG